jgi:hypothetical protein
MRTKRKAAKVRKPRAKELYFVIGGGINRTKCPTVKDAVEYAHRLLQEKNPSIELVGKDAILRYEGRLGMVEIPKIENAQCVGKGKPLYIVKVVGIVEIAPPPIIFRSPKADELP